MSIQPLINLDEPTEAEWKRKTRDAVNSLIKRLSGNGPTTGRPKGPVVGQMFYDTTLLKPIWWNGSVWKDANGTTV